jgi:type II secretory pathway pseudopilin PulG
LKKSFTLIEAIFVIVILAFVLIGGFQIIQKLYVRNYIVKQTSNFEFQSQQTLDELAEMLYFRVPLTTIGYSPSDNDFKYIGEIEEDKYPVLEWIGYVKDAMIEKNLSGFVDLYASDRNTHKIACRDFNKAFIEDIVNNKFKKTGDLNKTTAIIFAGSFDRGEEGALSDYNNSFGWHGNEHRLIYTFESGATTDSNNDTNLTLNNFTHGRIYEKFYLADSAYAIVRKASLNQDDWDCSDLSWDELDDDDLLLFYNYRPWLGETFCGDNNHNGTPKGDVTVLATNVSAIRVKKVNSHLELKITLNKEKGDINITVSKQKVAF